MTELNFVPYLTSHFCVFFLSFFVFNVVEGKLHQLLRGITPQVFILFINHRIFNVLCTWQGIYGGDCSIEFCPV